MKNYLFRIVAGVMALLAISTASLQAATKAAPQAHAIVVKVTGSASYSDEGGASKPLTEGTVLLAGASISTGINSAVVLDLGQNGQLVNIKDNTTVSLEKLTLQNTGSELMAETTLDVQKGRIVGNVKKLSAVSKYQVKTANGVAGIRGTAYEIYAVGIFRCISGEIVVTVRNLSNPAAPPQAFKVTPGNSVNASGDTVPALTPISAQEMKALTADVKKLQSVAFAIVTAGGQGGLPDAVKDLIAKTLAKNEGIAGGLTTLAEHVPNDERIRQIVKAAIDNINHGGDFNSAIQAGINVAASFKQQGTLLSVAQVQAAAAAAAQAYNAFGGSYGGQEAQAAAIAAASSSLAGGTAEQITRAAQLGAQYAGQILPGFTDRLIFPMITPTVVTILD